MRISVAGLTVSLDPRYRYTLSACRKYLLPDGEADVLVPRPTADEIERERVSDDPDFKKEEIPEAYLEYLAIHRALTERLLPLDRLLVHGSAIAVGGKGILFTAPSGVGKSTHTRLWREAFPDTVAVNDDKPYLSFSDEGIIVWGSPWDGKHRLSENIGVPLAAVVFVTRGGQNRITPMENGAYARLFSACYRPRDPALTEKTLSLVDRLAAVPAYLLACNTEPDAPIAARAGIKEIGT